MDEGLQRIDKIIGFLNQFPRRLEGFALTALDKQEPLMADLNREQLMAGIDAMGRKLKPYSPATRKQKTKKGEIADHTTLHETGSFHNLIEAKRFGKQWLLRSRDGKRDALIKDYGEEIEGLTEESMNKVADAALPDLETLIFNYLENV